MNEDELIKAFQKNIKYDFKEPNLLLQALCHSSYANEKRLKKTANNERLEFLGDAVLEIITSEFLYKNYPDVNEGELTKTRASIVCEPTLNQCAESISLGNYIFLGKGEKATGGSQRPSILSDALEAIIGAIYLDGGFTSAKEFINRFILTDIEDKKLFYDSKTILQEIIQGDHMGSIRYKLVNEEGPDHNKIFTSAVMLDGMQIEIGKGKTKKSAEQSAAYKAILKLRKKG